jgi:hypothetical protein
MFTLALVPAMNNFRVEFLATRLLDKKKMNSFR